MIKIFVIMLDTPLYHILLCILHSCISQLYFSTTPYTLIQVQLTFPNSELLSEQKQPQKDL